MVSTILHKKENMSNNEWIGKDKANHKKVKASNIQ